MMLVREQLARFIQSEGHRVELTFLDEDGRDAELLFRTRGYIVSVSVREGDAPHFAVTTGYEIPPWSRERGQNATTLQDIARDAGEVTFTLAPNGKSFLVTLESDASLEAFQRDFWQIVTKVREAGGAALERILDRTESRAAANKFIKSLLRGD